MLARCLARISIRHEDSNEEMVVFLVDKLSRKKSELDGINVKVKLLGGNKDCLNSYLNIASKYPTCDYMHVRSAADGAVIHLIEQSDLRGSFANKREYGLRNDLKEQREKMSKKKRREWDKIWFDISNGLIVHEIAHEMLRKFVSTLATVFRIQEHAEFIGAFPAKQEYHFAILDVQSATNADRDYGELDFNWTLQEDLDDNIENFLPQLTLV